MGDPVLRPMTAADCVGVTLRREDSLECRRSGARDDTEALRQSLLASAAAIVWTVDGRPAAFAGVVQVSATVGSPWLLTTDEARKHPVVMHRMALRFLASMASIGITLLHQHIDAEYRAALRWVASLGFVVLPPEPWGPVGALFCPVEWRPS